MSSKGWLRLLQLAFALLLSPAARADQAAFDAPGDFNPIVPGYFADPSIKKFGDTFYLYATTDGNGGGRGPSQVWASRDFVNWTLIPMNWPVGTEYYWAPDIIQRPDGHFYLYYNQPCMTFGAVGDSPIGPWSPLGGGNGLVVPNYLVKNVITLDAQLFEDTTGDLYMYWGTWGIYPHSGCGFGKLNPDMKSFSKLGMIPNTQAKEFFEGPFMLQRHGVYYFMYSSGDCHNSTYRVQYAVSDRPDGTFKMGPNNPILSTTEDHTVDGPGHHSVLQLGDDYYLIYHRHDIPFTPDGMQRQVCADRLVFGGDGVIEKVVPTHQGIGYLGPNSEPAPNLAFGKKVTADSFYHDALRHHDFKPEYAVDDNNATLWRPADNRMGHWLMVDLGSPQPIRRVLTQFEYATWFYQYLLETSNDGEHWQIFADRRQNTRWGSPMVDRGDVTARYVRLTITGVEQPGLFGAVWNIKVFGEDRADPLEQMADRAFNDIVAPRQAETPPLAWTATNSPVRPPLIALDSASLSPGVALNVWTNQGSLGGTFRADAAAPTVGMAAGRQAVRFFGHQLLKASFRAPRSLSGNGSFTVAAWVYNPEIAESECLVSWAGHDGPDAATAQINYGSNPNWGAVGHWGFADMGFHGGPPPANQWHHLAVVYDGVVERVYVDGELNHAAAKMLFMHAGEPIYVGASSPDTEFYDGFLASLRIYDTALNADEIKALYADVPAANVLVQLDAARLDYGPLTNWNNQGSVGGTFSTVTNFPAIADVDGRLAVRFQPGQILKSYAGVFAQSGKITLVATVKSENTGTNAPFEFGESPSTATPLTISLSDSHWHQAVWLIDQSSVQCYLDGKLSSTGSVPIGWEQRSLLLGGPDFSGAIARVEIIRHPLAQNEIEQLFSTWQREWAVPAAKFAFISHRLSPKLIGMTAQPDSQIVGGQYDFLASSSDHPIEGSGWSAQPFYLVDDIDPGASRSYTLKVRDIFGNITSTAAIVLPAADSTHLNSISDDFTVKHDYLAQGTTGTVWQGLMGAKSGESAETIVAADGVLRLQSRNSFWDGNQPRGPFLYQNVNGDFVAQVKVADYAGLANRQAVGADDGGLMVRLPPNGGPENFVQLTFFPPWNQGNMWTTMRDGNRYQKGNLMGFSADRYLQIVRLGAQFHFRTSPDGQQWREMPESPIERPDLAGKTLQVGLSHAAYGDQSSYISFSDYQLVTSGATPADSDSKP